MEEAGHESCLRVLVGKDNQELKAFEQVVVCTDILGRATVAPQNHNDQHFVLGVRRTKS